MDAKRRNELKRLACAKRNILFRMCYTESGYTEEMDCVWHSKRNGGRLASRQHELIWSPKGIHWPVASLFRYWRVQGHYRIVLVASTCTCTSGYWACGFSARCYWWRRLSHVVGWVVLRYILAWVNFFNCDSDVGFLLTLLELVTF